MKKKRIYNNIYHPRKIEAKICDQCGHKYIPNRRRINRQRFYFMESQYAHSQGGGV